VWELYLYELLANEREATVIALTWLLYANQSIYCNYYLLHYFYYI